MASAEVLAYRDAFAQVGEIVLLRKEYVGGLATGGDPPTLVVFDRKARARVLDYPAMNAHQDKLVDTMKQFDHLVLVLAEDLSGWGEPYNCDKIKVRGIWYSLESADIFTRAIGGTILAFQLLIKG